MGDKHMRKMAVSATLHCLTGCAIGEIIGMVIGAAFNLSNLTTIILSIFLAFIFGYILSLRSFLQTGVTLAIAIPIVLAADSLSIATMEIVDNAIVVVIPGALDATLVNPLFWLSLAVSLALAFVAAVPVNYYLLKRGRGHALTHADHHKMEHHHD